MTRLSVEDIEALDEAGVRCACTDSYCSLRTRLDLTVEQIVARRVAAALTEAADAIEADRDDLERAGAASLATGCHRAAAIVRNLANP